MWLQPPKLVYVCILLPTLIQPGFRTPSSSKQACSSESSSHAKRKEQLSSNPLLAWPVLHTNGVHHKQASDSTWPGNLSTASIIANLIQYGTRHLQRSTVSYSQQGNVAPRGVICVERFTLALAFTMFKKRSVFETTVWILLLNLTTTVGREGSQFLRFLSNAVILQVLHVHWSTHHWSLDSKQ